MPCAQIVVRLIYHYLYMLNKTVNSALKCCGTNTDTNTNFLPFVTFPFAYYGKRLFSIIVIQGDSR